MAAIIATPDGVTVLHRRALAQLAPKRRVPGMSWLREYVVNVRTARAMALTIPPMLLQRADHVIE